METKPRQRNYLPTKPISTLREREFYLIYKSKSLQTKFGRAILVWLYNPDITERFKVFLPAAVCKQIPDDNPEDSEDEDAQCDIMPSSVGWLPQYKMAYYGKEKLNNDFTRCDVRFYKYDRYDELPDHLW